MRKAGAGRRWIGKLDKCVNNGMLENTVVRLSRRLEQNGHCLAVADPSKRFGRDSAVSSRFTECSDASRPLLAFATVETDRLHGNMLSAFAAATQICLAQKLSGLRGADLRKGPYLRHCFPGGSKGWIGSFRFKIMKERLIAFADGRNEFLHRWRIFAMNKLAACTLPHGKTAVAQKYPELLERLLRPGNLFSARIIGY